MITTLQFDIQTAKQRQKLQLVLDYVANIQLPFRKKDIESDELSDWSGKWSTYEMTTPVLARDWDNEDCWDELYEQTKSTTL